MRSCLLYNVPNKSIKYTSWHDGFTKAISILQKTFNIDMINSFNNPKINFNEYTFVFFKESFNGNIYRKYKSQLSKNNILGLFISASNIIPNNTELNIYDILFYETKWYHDYAKLDRHSNAHHAFGIDNTVMKPKIQEKIYDVIFVGNIVDYKRPLKILDLPGKKICLGFKNNNVIIKKLLENDVEILDFIEYHKLAEFYNKSKLCYIPCLIHGGGERAVLEARSCGIPVKIEDDNPKLKELCESEIYSSIYYSKQIEKVFYKYIYNEIKNNEYSTILKKLKNFNLNVLKIGGMDGETFDLLYNNISNNWNVTILEPIKYQLDKQKKNYTMKHNVTVINKALNYMTIEELNYDRIDILQSDTEGFDYNILKILLAKYKPYVILFEWNNLPEKELDGVKKLLIDYDMTFFKQDALCILKQIDRHKIKVNLHYFDGWHNFGDELSKYITTQLINKDKYDLVFNQNNIPLNIICIGSYIQTAKNNSFIFGSGVRTYNNIEKMHNYSNLNVASVRGPLSRDFLINVKKISVPEIYGDPALLLPRFYKPNIISSLKDKIGVIPHKTNYSKYKDNIDSTKYFLINPTDKWENVINHICSCKANISSSLHGLICSDAYNIPNVWLDEFKLSEGDFKFKDYFASQKRNYVKIKNLKEYDSKFLYKGGNTIDLDKLLKTFPFN